MKYKANLDLVIVAMAVIFILLIIWFIKMLIGGQS